MIGSLLTRGLVMVLGYAYPAFECYKTVEQNKPEICELRFWCQYWILVAMLTVTERVGDVFISWVPMYSEAKLAFYIYLWFPKTRGTTYVYDSFFKPYMAKHETEIDRSLVEFRTRAGDIALIYWQRAASYAHTRIFDIQQFVVFQSTVRTRPDQPEQSHPRTTSGTSRPIVNGQPETEAPLSPASSTSSSHHSEDVAEVSAPAPKVTASAPRAPNSPRPITQDSKSYVSVSSLLAESSAAASQAKPEDVEIDHSTATSTEQTNPPPKNTVIEETLRVTRARFRKNRSTAGTAK